MLICILLTVATYSKCTPFPVGLWTVLKRFWMDGTTVYQCQGSSSYRLCAAFT